MDTIVTTASAATVASVCTSLAKFGFPNLPSYAVMLLSVVAGIGASFLVSLSQGDVLGTQAIAANVLTGILAAATAAGVSRADKASDVVRGLALTQDNTKV